MIVTIYADYWELHYYYPRVEGLKGYVLWYNPGGALEWWRRRIGSVRSARLPAWVYVWDSKGYVTCGGLTGM